MVSFSQLPAVKNSIFGAAKSKLDLSYFLELKSNILQREKEIGKISPIFSNEKQNFVIFEGVDDSEGRRHDIVKKNH